VMSFFTLNMGQASTQPDLSLRDILARSCHRISAVYNLTDRQSVLSGDSTPSRILEAIFDPGALGFVGEESTAILAQLPGSSRACLLAQAIAGIICIFERLAKSSEVTPETFDRALLLFSGSEQRTSMLSSIERSGLFNRCYLKSQIVELIAASLRRECRESPAEEAEQDLSWATELPPRNLGVPWGLSIMVLN